MRHMREERQIALTTIVEKTKIKQSLLEGLERDDLSHWPNGFFRRAFVRAYAQAIGVAPDEAVREFLEFHCETIDGNAAGASARGRAVNRGEEVPVGDLLAIANLCTHLSLVQPATSLAPLLQEAARILDARGLIIWTWDQAIDRLRPSWAHGYSDAVLLQLPLVAREAENAVAAAFRSARTSYVGGDEACHAVVVPLLIVDGCLGVLAIELEGGGVPARVEAIAKIVASQLSRVVAETTIRADNSQSSTSTRTQ